MHAHVHVCYACIHTHAGSSLPQPLLPHPPVPTSVPPSSSQTQTQQQLPFFTPPPPQIITSPKAAAIPIAPATISATPSAVAPASSETKPQASSTPLVVGTTQNSVAGVCDNNIMATMFMLIGMQAKKNT